MTNYDDYKERLDSSKKELEDLMKNKESLKVQQRVNDNLLNKKRLELVLLLKDNPFKENYQEYFDVVSQAK